MAQFKSFAQNVLVNGETVLSIVDAMGSFKRRAYEILENKGIKEPVATHWYPQQAFLDAFKTISEEIGKKTLYAIGNKIPNNARFPPEIDSIEKALASIDIAYHMNHKGGEIGTYSFKQTGPRTAKLVCRNPYPCDFDRGIIFAMADKFKPDKSLPHVQHDDDCPCRENGGESCTYTVKW